jgi:hypothetical protein
MPRRYSSLYKANARIRVELHDMEVNESNDWPEASGGLWGRVVSATSETCDAPSSFKHRYDVTCRFAPCSRPSDPLLYSV